MYPQGKGLILRYHANPNPSLSAQIPKGRLRDLLPHLVLCLDGLEHCGSLPSLVLDLPKRGKLSKVLPVCATLGSLDLERDGLDPKGYLR